MADFVVEKYYGGFEKTISNLSRYIVKVLKLYTECDYLIARDTETIIF